MPKVVESYVLEPGRVTNCIPYPLYLLKVLARLGAREHVRISSDARERLQERRGSLRKRAITLSGLCVGEAEVTSLEIDGIPESDGGDQSATDVTRS